MSAGPAENAGERDPLLLPGTAAINSADDADPQAASANAGAADRTIFWFVWMGALLVYATLSAILASVKWWLEINCSKFSCIASDVFDVLSVLLWFIVTIDFALNVHWMTDAVTPEQDDYEERLQNSCITKDIKKYVKKYSRWIRIPLVWIIINIMLPLKAADTITSDQELPWNSHNVSGSLDTSLFFASCTIYFTILLLLCLLMAIHTYEVWKIDYKRWKIIGLVVCYYICIFAENVLRNSVIFIWFSHTSEINSYKPFLTGLIPVSYSMMLIPFLIVIGFNDDCRSKHRVLSFVALVLTGAFILLTFYLTIFLVIPVYKTLSTIPLFILSVMISIITMIVHIIIIIIRYKRQK